MKCVSKQEGSCSSLMLASPLLQPLGCFAPSRQARSLHTSPGDSPLPLHVLTDTPRPGRLSSQLDPLQRLSSDACGEPWESFCLCPFYAELFYCLCGGMCVSIHVCPCVYMHMYVSSGVTRCIWVHVCVCVSEDNLGCHPSGRPSTSFLIEDFLLGPGAH